MPSDVHPQIQVILDRAVELGVQRLQDMTLTAGRAQAEALAEAGRKAFPPPQVTSVENTTTGPGYSHVPVRIYRMTAKSTAPAIVYFHGGGHVICSLETHDTIARSIAVKTGCTLISVDYRMGPEHPFPAAVLDSFDALRWVNDNCEKLNIDQTKIAVCGDSAGGNLAAVVALMARGQIDISAQVLVYPVIDYRGGTPSFERYGEGYGSLSAATMQWFLERYLPESSMRDDWRACPRNAEITPDLPPALVLVAECDVLHDDGVNYATQLKQAGVNVQFEEYSGMTHGFFGFLGQVNATNDAHETVAAFLQRVWKAADQRRS